MKVTKELPCDVTMMKLLLLLNVWFIIITLKVALQNFTTLNPIKLLVPRLYLYVRYVISTNSYVLRLFMIVHVTAIAIALLIIFHEYYEHPDC